MKVRSEIFKTIIVMLMVLLMLPIAAFATSETSLDLAIDKFRGKDSDGTYPAYALPNQYIYKVYQKVNSTTADYDRAIYCLDAARGFVGSGHISYDKVTYSTKYDMLTQRDNVINNETSQNGSFSSDDYDKVLRILKNIYISGTTDKATFLNIMLDTNGNIYDGTFDDNGQFVCDGVTYYITDKDIDVVQQLAIWHFTNESSITDDTTFGNYLGDELTNDLLVSIYSDEAKTTVADLITRTGKTDVTASLLDSTDTYKYYKFNEIQGYYKTASHAGSLPGVISTGIVPEEYKGMKSRFTAIQKIYEKLVQIGNDTSISTSNPEEPLEMAETSANVERDGAYYVAGPFKITKNNDEYENFSAQVKDENGNTISDYQLLNSSKNSTSGDISSLIGENFYIKIPYDTTVKKIKVSFSAKYNTNTFTYWTKQSALSSTQPVVLVEKESLPLSGEKEVSIPEKEKVQRKVIKVWEDEDNRYETRPTEIKVQLKADGVAYGDEVTLNESNGWQYEWNELEKNNEEGEITYTVDEVSVPDGYIKEITNDGVTYTIKNSYHPEKTQRKVEKVWNDDGNEDKRPVEIQVQLKADGIAYGDMVTLNAENGWQYEWTNLDKNDESGHEIVYDIEEISVPEGYETEVTKEEKKFIITNTYKNKNIDLALRKFITKVGTVEHEREPETKIENLIPNGTEQTARYIHPKNPVNAKIGDIVTYTIRVYNEGESDAYVGEVTDYLPEELDFIMPTTEEEIAAALTDTSTDTSGEETADDKTNIDQEKIKAIEFNGAYGWNYDAATRKISTTILSKEPTGYEGLQTEIIKAQKDRRGEDSTALLKAFDGRVLDYIDLQVKCKINDKATRNEKITNIAEITEYEDETGTTVENDRDSEPKNFPDSEKNNNYEGNGEIDGYFPGKQDDDDFERLIIRQFDLALRKYISDVDGNATTLREPVVDITKLKDGTDTTAEYNHVKQPLTVVKGSLVTYNIRVYNEGDIDGYVNEITDYLPPELEYVEDSEINNQYKWELSKDGTFVTTDYLKYQYGKTDNLLKAYDGGDNLDYREVKIQCKVRDTAQYQRNITNLAQITEDSDGNGEDIDDRDSVPNGNFDLPKGEDLPKYKDDELSKSYVPGQEDDDDFEKINVVYFDLALRKIVSKAIVTENGETVTTETNHKFEDDPEAIVKVDLGRRKLNNLTVKFEYQIRITNEGLIEGYAKEIRDDVPEGLVFNVEDNPLWKLEEDGTITTEQLKDRLLKPGENAVISVILTWKNGQDNLGIKTNTAEISKDYNKYNTPDIDSTPDNKKEGEDDIDIAEVMLSIALGRGKTYLGLTVLMLSTTALGIVLIRKFVL